MWYKYADDGNEDDDAVERWVGCCSVPTQIAIEVRSMASVKSAELENPKVCVQKVGPAKTLFAAW